MTMIGMILYGLVVAVDGTGAKWLGLIPAYRQYLKECKIVSKTFILNELARK